MPFSRSTLLGLFTMLFLANACAPASTPQVTAQSSASLAHTAYEHVIFDDGAWLPTTEMIATLEAHLPAFLAQHQTQFNADKPPIAERLRQYKFQYWGENVNGNAFCCAPDNWRTQRVLVLDGGD